MGFWDTLKNIASEIGESAVIQQEAEKTIQRIIDWPWEEQRKYILQTKYDGEQFQDLKMSMIRYCSTIARENDIPGLTGKAITLSNRIGLLKK